MDKGESLYEIDQVHWANLLIALGGKTFFSRLPTKYLLIAAQKEETQKGLILSLVVSCEA